MQATAYVFITSHQAKRVVQELRELSGVVKVDALFGTPDVIAVVEGADIGAVDAVIDRIAEMPEVLATDSRVARWIKSRPGSDRG
jgi:DNA-binding Lrp family transcriptional regulator